MNEDEFLAIKKRSKMTYKEIGNLVGRSNKTIYNYANGDIDIPDDVIIVMREIEAGDLPM